MKAADVNHYTIKDSYLEAAIGLYKISKNISTYYTLAITIALTVLISQACNSNNNDTNTTTNNSQHKTRHNRDKNVVHVKSNARQTRKCSSSLSY